MGSEAMSGGTSPNSVIPAKAGIPLLPPTRKRDASLRWHDGYGVCLAVREIKR